MGHEGTTAAGAIADRVWSDYQGDDTVELLRQLGWSDVLEQYEQLEEAEYGYAAQVQNLKNWIAELEPLYRAHKDKDLQYWRSTIAKETVEHPEFKPDEFSPRRIDMAAKSMMLEIRRYEDLVQELADLEAEGGPSE